MNYYEEIKSYCQHRIYHLHLLWKSLVKLGNPWQWEEPKLKSVAAIQLALITPLIVLVSRHQRNGFLLWIFVAINLSLTFMLFEIHMWALFLRLSCFLKPFTFSLKRQYGLVWVLIPWKYTSSYVNYTSHVNSGGIILIFATVQFDTNVTPVKYEIGILHWVSTMPLTLLSMAKLGYFPGEWAKI